MSKNFEVLSDDELLRRYNKEAFKLSLCYAMLNMNALKPMVLPTETEEPGEREARLVKISKLAKRHLRSFHPISEELRRRLRVGAEALARNPAPQPKPGSAYDLPTLAKERIRRGLL